MTDIDDSITGVPGSNMDDGRVPTTPEGPALGKRQRLLKGIQRISSSQSLSGLRRSKSIGSPYKQKVSLSCVSLVGTGPPSSATSSTAFSSPSPLAFSSTASTTSSTPTTEFPLYSEIEGQVSARKIDGVAPTSVPATASLPSELTWARQDAQSRSRAASKAAALRPPFHFWAKMPHEIQVYILSYLQPKELVRTSRVSKAFYQFCFDGQLWSHLDASEFYQDIPAQSLTRIIVAAGPFIKNLNLRGCVQVEHYKRTEAIVKACKNLMCATLQDCRNMQKHTVHTLLGNNEKLVQLNLSGLSAVSKESCDIIAKSCPQLEVLDVSWCDNLEATGLKAIIKRCPKLKDLRAGEVRGFQNISVASLLFKTNNLERLVLRGCVELTDEALEVILHGVEPEVDILTGLPVVPPRKLRHLDLGRCTQLSDDGVSAIGHLTPDLEGLQLSGCKALTNAALEPILASTPRLTHLELEDLEELTNPILSEHLAKAPCAANLEHLSIGYCAELGDAGMLPVMRACVNLRSLDLDNTRVSDLVLAEAAVMVDTRSERTFVAGTRPKMTLHMAVYDCQNITWTGIREVLFRNAQIKLAPGHTGKVTYPSEMIGLKVMYGFQMTVDEHQKRVLKGDLGAAGRLERKWADYMQANEEAGMVGAGHRRRRRRAREAQALHANEEDAPNGRGRARTTGSCALM